MRARSNWFAALALALALAPSAAFAKKAADGKPAFQAAGPEGFFVWHDETGWHLRVVAGGKQRSAHGVIRQQAPADLKTTRAAINSKVSVDAHAIRFDFDVFKGTVDGFDWHGQEPCVTLELKLDQLAKNEIVHVGKSGESPSAMPFDACQ